MPTPGTSGRGGPVTNFHRCEDRSVRTLKTRVVWQGTSFYSSAVWPQELECRYETAFLFFFCMCLLASCLILTAAARGLSEELPVDSAVQGDGSAALAHFETHVRPLLIKRCQSCHSAADDTLEGGLALDSRAGWQEGGDSGPAVVPGDPEASLLVRAIRYSDPERIGRPTALSQASRLSGPAEPLASAPFCGHVAFSPAS